MIVLVLSSLIQFQSEELQIKGRTQYWVNNISLVFKSAKLIVDRGLIVLASFTLLFKTDAKGLDKKSTVGELKTLPVMIKTTIHPSLNALDVYPVDRPTIEPML